MKIEPGTYCPLLKKDCIQMQCAWFIKVMGAHPQTGKEVEEWGCSIAWLPILMIENSQQQRQTGAAVESFRNEMVKSNQNTTQALLKTLAMNEEEQRKAIGGR